MSHLIKDLLEASPFPAIVVSPDERIEALNAAAAHLLGSGSVGRHYIAIIRQPALLDAIETSLRSGERKSARYLSTEAQKDMTWNAHVAPIADMGSVLVTFEDKTATEEANEMRRNFVANVSHELRTPLTALLGFIETLKGAARDDPDARKRFLGIMEREASRMNRLVRDLLSLNRVESEERVRPNEKVDLAAQVQSVANTLSPLADENEVALMIKNTSSPAFVSGDADQLAQVITNLTENAIKYSGAGKEVAISIDTTEHHDVIRGPAVILRIADTGDGIDPIHIPRLTERFYRIDSHRSRELGGTGLGLAIVKHIVGRHRGRLRIESELGQGSKFSVILPKYQASRS
ncbi:MAG: ATP-binding protein [Boseongicola sp.]